MAGSSRDFRRIYAEQADAYDALVRAEDCEGRLLPALESVAPLAGAHVLEVGAGTGRITELVLSRGARVVAVEPGPAMLALARRRLRGLASTGGELLRAEARRLPLRPGWADVAIAGWVFGHLLSWEHETWLEAVAAALAEMDRALRPGGTLIVVETLGTGETSPAPPTRELAEYYAWLGEAQGMRSLAIRTDYSFADAEAAARATAFFFGDDFAARVRREGWSRIPECTGVWWRARRQPPAPLAGQGRAAEDLP